MTEYKTPLHQRSALGRASRHPLMDTRLYSTIRREYLSDSDIKGNVMRYSRYNEYLAEGQPMRALYEAMKNRLNKPVYDILNSPSYENKLNWNYIVGWAIKFGYLGIFNDNISKVTDFTCVMAHAARIGDLTILNRYSTQPYNPITVARYAAEGGDEKLALQFTGNDLTPEIYGELAIGAAIGGQEYNFKKYIIRTNDEYRIKVLENAVSSGNLEITEYLIRYLKPNTNILKNLFYLALTSEQKEIIDYLIDKKGIEYYPLFRRIFNENNEALLQLFIKYIDTNMLIDDAINNNDENILKFLLNDDGNIEKAYEHALYTSYRSDRIINFLQTEYKIEHKNSRIDLGLAVLNRDEERVKKILKETMPTGLEVRTIMNKYKRQFAYKNILNILQDYLDNYHTTNTLQLAMETNDEKLFQNILDNDEGELEEDDLQKLVDKYKYKTSRRDLVEKLREFMRYNYGTGELPDDDDQD